MKKVPEKVTDTDISVVVKKTATRFTLPLEYKIISDKDVNLTRDRAFAFLEMKQFSGERPVRDLHVQYLYDEYKAGRFLWHACSIASCSIKGSDDVYRINGQHTCWMRVNISEADEPLKAVVRELQYEVESDEQLRALYSTFDRNAPRTIGHISAVQLMDSEAGAGIPVSYIRNLVSGFRIFESPDWRLTRRPTEVVESIKQKHSTLFNVVGRFYAQVVDEGIFVKRAAVIGGIFATFEKGVKIGEEFWRPVVTGLGIEKATDPRHKLREFLQTHSMGLNNARKRGVSAEQMYRACITCWNNWRQDEPMQKVNVASDTSGKRAAVKS